MGQTRDVDPSEDAPVALLTTQLDSTITRVNRTFERWTGFARDAVIGRKRAHELLAPGDRIFYETHYAPLLHMQGEVRAIAVEVVGADGRRLPALMTSSIVRGEDGRPESISTVLFDASDRRVYERELLQEKREAQESEARARLLSRTLQESLIPPTPPQIPTLDVGAVYRPAGTGDEVGGDFYDVFEVPGNEWGVVLGDVTGKGVAAAVVTALARYTIRAAVMQSTRPRSVLTMLNAALLRDDVDRPVTAIYASVAPSARSAASLTVTAAGHPLPLLLDGEGVRPVGRPGMMLGIDPDPPLHEEQVPLGRGMAIVFYTDGITEARRGTTEWFGEDRLDQTLSPLAGRSASDIAATLVDDAVRFQRGAPRDDIAVVVVASPVEAV
jgi:sigma-B regulation protein RsbU (phosphoserine phosphatase)